MSICKTPNNQHCVTGLVLYLFDRVVDAEVINNWWDKFLFEQSQLSREFINRCLNHTRRTSAFLDHLPQALDSL